jgi:hypothetical protein
MPTQATTPIKAKGSITIHLRAHDASSCRVVPLEPTRPEPLRGRPEPVEDRRRCEPRWKGNGSGMPDPEGRDGSSSSEWPPSCGVYAARTHTARPRVSYTHGVRAVFGAWCGRGLLLWPAVV